jgi:peptide/nickel transport system permease protein
MSRARYIAGKLIGAVGTLFFVLVLNFFLFRILPGDPARTLTRLQRSSPSTIEAVKKELGLDRPLPVQFVDYLGDTARGELGISYVFTRPVSEVIAGALWPTILLVGVATIGATVIGMLIGIWGGWRRGSAIDTTTLGFGLITYAMPEFWLGMLLILLFAVALGWFPTSFMTTPGLVDASAGAQLVDTLEHLFLPALTLVLALLGEYALIMRSSVIEAMNEDYVTTARAKGMREALVLRKHVVPNALLPVVTLAALNIGFIVSGAITVEVVFSWPGLGQLTFRAINGGPDYPLLQGLFLVFSAAVIFANLAADLLLGLLDPRIGRA